MQALIASAYLAMISDSTSTSNIHINSSNNTTTITSTPTNHNDDNTIFLICVTILLLAVHDAIGILGTMWRTLTRLLSRPTPATAEMVTEGTDVSVPDDPVHEPPADCPQCAALSVELIEARNELRRLQAYQEEFVRRYQDTRARMLSAQRQVAELQPNTEFILTRSQADARLQWAIQRDAHFTRTGEVWHADPQCGPIRRCQVISRRPCQLCVLPLADESTYRRSLVGMGLTQHDVSQAYITGEGANSSTG